MSQIHQEKPSRWFSNAPSVIVVIYFKTIKRGKEKWLHIITVNWLSLVPIQCQQESPFWGAWKRKLYSVQTVRLWYSAAVRTAQSCYSSIKRDVGDREESTQAFKREGSTFEAPPCQPPDAWSQVTIIVWQTAIIKLDLQGGLSSGVFPVPPASESAEMLVKCTSQPATQNFLYRTECKGVKPWNLHFKKSCHRVLWCSTGFGENEIGKALGTQGGGRMLLFWAAQNQNVTSFWRGSQGPCLGLSRGSQGSCSGLSWMAVQATHCTSSMTSEELSWSRPS